MTLSGQGVSKCDGMATGKSERSEEVIRKAYNHVLYEFSMLHATARLMQKPRLERAADRALLESFVIHMRNLLDFLYNTPKKDDIAAEHFVPAATWRSARPQLSTVIRDARKRAPKEVAHLTYTRLSATDKDIPWPVPGIVKEVSEAFNKFVDLAKANRPSLAQQHHMANTVVVMTTFDSRYTTTLSKGITLTADTPE